MKGRKNLIVSLLLAGVLLICILVTGKPARALLAGDVNGDGAVTAADARVTLRCAVFLDTLNYGTAAFAAADLDEDMLITSSDARGILRMAVGLDPNRSASYTGGNSGSESYSYKEPSSYTEPSKGGNASGNTSAYETGKYVNTTDSALNLRAGPSTSSQVLGSIAMLEIVTVTEVRENTGADAETHWWGKVTVNGETGWCALYYMTPWNLRNHTFTSAETTALWNSLSGYWEALDGSSELFRFYTQGGQYRAVNTSAGGYTYLNGTLSGAVRGDPKGLAAVTLSPSSGGSDVTLFLDVSEAENGRLVWKYTSASFPGDWVEAEYIGASY